MTVIPSKIFSIIVTALFLSLNPSFASAQTYPKNMIRLIAPFAPGGTVDVVARRLAIGLSQEFKQDVIVENKAGASGNIGSAFVAESVPDGYNLLVNNTTMITNPFLMNTKVPYDAMGSFTHLALISSTQLVFVVNAKSDIRSVADFVGLAKTNPGKVNFGVGGYGSSGHMAQELLNLRAGISVPMITYKGSAPAVADLIGGRLTGQIDPLLLLMPQISGGQLRPIAVTGDKRSPLLPDVPSMAEVGYPDIAFTTWYGLYGPRNLPAPVAQRIQSAVTKVLETAEMKDWLAKQGMQAGNFVGNDFRDYVQREIRKTEQVVKEANVKPL